LDQFAVQIGAGNIGRGFIAQLFHESGYQIHFVDADRVLVDRLNAADEYSIEIAARPSLPSLHISNFYAYHASDGVAVADALTRASIASISAGAKAQSAIAKMLAAALGNRLRENAPPLNILVCENPPGVAPAFREAVRSHLDGSLHAAFDARIAFVDTVIGRMVPVLGDAAGERDPLAVRVEPYCELPVDGDAIVGELPEVAHLHAESPFEFWIDRKLFMHNAAHAAAAYVGHLHGHEYIHEAVVDERVRCVVEGVLNETALALSRKYDHDLSALESHAGDLVSRFENSALLDTVERVARDPLRKLASGERFLRAAACCQVQGIEPQSLSLATAAAIRYDHSSDPSAEIVQKMLCGKGWDEVLREVCGLAPEDPFAALVKGSGPALTPGKTTES
jgi:mannitol-1-phosphate 5-dehydrogenase